MVVFALALAPPFFLVIFRISAKKAMPIVFFITCIIGYLVWGISVNRIFASVFQGLVITASILWIIFGVVFMGAAHDFGVLVLSMQNKGKSIAHVCEDLLGAKVKNLFLLVIFFLVCMVIAVFALVIAT